MGSPLNVLIRTEDTLHILAEHLLDAQQGLQRIGEELRSEPLKRRFLAESLKRAEFRGEIEAILHQEGEHDIHIHGTAEAAVVRAWARLQHVLGAGESALVSLAQEGERALADAYRAALEKDLPLPVRQTLASQVTTVHQFIDYIAETLDSHASAV